MSTVGEPEDNGWQRFLVEPPRPDAIRRMRNGYRLAVAAVCIGAFMGQLDASIVTLAFPSLARAFHAGPESVSWVGLSYLLVLVATVAAVGRFADMVGRKLLYVYGFAIFIAGSALCAAAPSLLVLDLCRAFQAVGAAMLQANSVAIIALAVPAARLGRSLGLQGAAQALGLALGPSVGGLLLAAGGWRLIFLVNVPVGLVGMAAAVVFVPRSRHLQARVPFDWAGFALFFPAIVAVMFAISQGNRLGWATAAIAGALVAALVLGAAFVQRERRHPAPMVDVRLFLRRTFTAGITSSLLAFAVLFGVLVVVPFYFERSLRASTVRTGLELMAMPVALGLVAPFSGRMADRFGVRAPAAVGMSVAGLALLGLAGWRPGPWGFALLLAVVGAGLGLFNAPNNAGIMASVPPDQSGLASGLLNMSRGLGTALGLAVSTAVFVGTGGDGGEGGDVARAFSVTIAVLAGVAGLAALVAGMGARRGPLASRSVPMAERAPVAGLIGGARPGSPDRERSL
jgi:EmrB/QacA subfamily drug resistance transporter